jgi:hypothetical protein
MTWLKNGTLVKLLDRKGQGAKRQSISGRRDSIKISNFCQFKLSTGLVGLELGSRTLMNHNKVGSGLKVSKTPVFPHRRAGGYK